VGNEKTLAVTNEIEQPFLNDDEAKFIIKNLTPTSHEYIKLKKKEAEEALGRKLELTEYRRLRDCTIAEVCAIELQDARIRQHHGYPPADQVQ